MNPSLVHRLAINGREPEMGELARLAQINYGHFTSLQVRSRAARGFSLHLQRLAAATRELFGSELDTGQVRMQLRALLDDAPCSVRITVFSTVFDRGQPERPVPTDVLMAITAARTPPAKPLRLRSVVHERTLPAIKHVGTFGVFHELRRARRDGFDDALLCTPSGEVSEGTTWNIGFVDGGKIVWPLAPALAGITRQLLDRGLRGSGISTESRHIRLDELAAYRACFIVNAGSVGPMVEGIDDIRFSVDAELPRLIESAYASQPLEAI